MRRKIIFILGFILISPLPLLAQVYNYQEDSVSARGKAAQEALEAVEREMVMEETLRDITIELTLGYGFAGGGKQTFELLDSLGGLASRLTYPLRGNNRAIFKGEIGFRSKLFLGGRYSSSSFKRRVCSDEDWNLFDPLWGFGTDEYIDYQISRQMSKSKAEFYDMNLYYRLLDLGRESLSEKKDLSDNLGIEELALDIFAGYQYQKNRCRMIDPMTEMLRFDEGWWYYAVGLPANVGLNSFYEIEYQGPRIGLRVIGSKDKLTTKISLAYAYLETEAEGWWNIRNLSFWQKGKGGSGFDLELEVGYAFNPNFSLGVGFDYLYRHQKKLKLYAVEDGTPWWDGYQERVRDADSSIYFPTFFVRVAW